MFFYTYTLSLYANYYTRVYFDAKKVSNISINH